MQEKSLAPGGRDKAFDGAVAGQPAVKPGRQARFRAGTVAEPTVGVPIAQHWNARMRLAQRILAGACLCAAALLSTPALAAPWDLDELMAALARTTKGHATFVETKTMAMLERPVVSSGELFYTAPNELVKRTMKPSAETMSVSGSTLRLERGNQRHTLQLTDYPELAGFIASIRGTLAGDRRALEQSFALRLEGPAERWLLTLKPVEGKLGRSVHLIRIQGAREKVASIEIIQGDGDRTVMAITPVAVQ